MAPYMVRTKVSSCPGRHSRIFSSISGTSATRTRTGSGMAHDEQAPCQLAERLDALRAQPVAPVAARGRMLRMRGEDGGRTPLPALLSEEREHLPGILGIKVSRRLIGQHEPRLAEEPARERRALQLGAGK